LRLLTLPAWWRRITASLIISVWMPKSPVAPTASSRPISSGMAPMPNWSVAPSSISAAACRAIASSSAAGSGAGMATSGSSCSTTASTSDTCTRLPPSAASPPTRGMRGFTSAIASRSGSRAASMNGLELAPAVMPKLSHPSRSGSEVTARTTRGFIRQASRSRPWKSAGRYSMSIPASRADRSIGPKKPLTTRTPGFRRRAKGRISRPV
jgi:hypothetical protein